MLVVNTPDNRIEAFDLTGGFPVHVGSVPVGLDPVSVRARTNSEVWVTNLISDSVSIVNLASGNVVSTLSVGDEPTDVVFAGNPHRAFVCVSQENAVKVYDPNDLSAAPLVVTLEGEDPRALATDGQRVYAAIFQSGNGTTVLNEVVVGEADGPYGGENPPPNCGDDFCPPIAAGLPTPPHVSIIVQKDANGQWMDENDHDWSSKVTWDLHDHDVAILPVSNPSNVSYAEGLMTADMALATMHDGRVAVVGTEAMNLFRFEPNLNGHFVRVVMGVFNPLGPSTVDVEDLNPHLTYEVSTIPPAERVQSIADPRGIAWSDSSNLAYVSGMGSNNVIVTNSNGTRIERIEVGSGPSSLWLDEARARLYVLNRFDATISVLDTGSNAEIGRVGFYDPTPEVIHAGRPMLYDSHDTSGLGQVACASCHLDGRIDQVSWDLGNPEGEMKTFNQDCRSEGCEDWHPMKGPMATQTLAGIVGTEPLHWRGDKEDLAAFSPAFVGLMGRETEPTASQMQDFEDFVATLRFPPNPFRNLDNTVPNTIFPNGGNPSEGEFLFHNAEIAGGSLTCNECHAVPTGTNGQIVAADELQEAQGMKVAQLRNMYEKTGFDELSSNNNRGFGYIHDGSTDNLFNFLKRPVFQFPPGPTGDQQRRDIEAFMFVFSTDVHTAVGLQVTANADNLGDPGLLGTLQGMIALANTEEVGMVVKGLMGGLQRGAYYSGGGVFQSDRASETIAAEDLLAMAGEDAELTATVVPFESRIRIGVDRDEDGKFDRDELDAGTDPADPAS